MLLDESIKCWVIRKKICKAMTKLIPVYILHPNLSDALISTYNKELFQIGSKCKINSFCLPD